MEQGILLSLMFPFGAIVLCIIVYIVARIYFAIRDGKSRARNKVPEISPEEQQKLNSEMENNPLLKEALAAAEGEIGEMEQSDIYIQVCKRIDKILKQGQDLGVENAVTGVHVAGSMVLLGSRFGLNEEKEFIVIPDKSYEQNKKACRFGESEDLRFDISPHLTDTNVIALAGAITRYLDKGRGMYETELYDLPVMEAPKKIAITCGAELSDGTPLTLHYGMPPFNTANSVLKKDYFNS